MHCIDSIRIENFYKNVRFNWRKKIALLQYVRFNVRRGPKDVRVWLFRLIDIGFFIGVDEAGGMNFVFGVEAISTKNSNWSWLSIETRSLKKKTKRYRSDECFCITYVFVHSMSSSILHMNRCANVFSIFSMSRIDWREKNEWIRLFSLLLFLVPLSLSLSSSILCIIICSSLTHSFTHFIEACR